MLRRKACSFISGNNSLHVWCCIAYKADYVFAQKRIDGTFLFEIAQVWLLTELH